MNICSTPCSHGGGCRITKNKRGQASIHKHFSNITIGIVTLPKTSHMAEPRLKGWRNSLPFVGRGGKVAKGCTSRDLWTNLGPVLKQSTMLSISCLTCWTFSLHHIDLLSLPGTCQAVSCFCAFSCAVLSSLTTPHYPCPLTASPSGWLIPIYSFF